MRIPIALLFFLSGTMSQAADPARPTKPERNARVCRDSAETGTRIRSSECHLRSDWVEIDAVRRKQYEELNRGLNNGAAAEQAPTARPYP